HVHDFMLETTSFRSASLWDTESGQTTTLPTSSIRGVAASPNGQMIAAAELDSKGAAVNFRAVVREVGSWKTLASFDTEGDTASRRFSPDSSRLATGTRTGWIQIWDLTSRREIARARASESDAYYLDFSKDGEWLVSTSVDRIGRVYDISGSRMKLLET